MPEKSPGSKGRSPDGKSGPTGRRERLAQALRANLKRRKRSVPDAPGSGKSRESGTSGPARE